MHVTIMQRVYQLTSSAVPLPGEDERLYVVAFLPAAARGGERSKRDLHHSGAAAMRTATIMMGAALAALSCGLAQAQQSPPPASPPTPAVSAESAPPAAAAPAAAFTVDPRLVFSGDGMTLTGITAAAAARSHWLGNYGPGDVSAWASNTRRSPTRTGPTAPSTARWRRAVGANVRTSLYAEAHEGAGDIGRPPSTTRCSPPAGSTTFNSYASVQLEERRIDIDTSHGNLPKIGLSLRLLPQLLASLSYAESFGGNLGTKLGTVRLDYVSKASTGWRALPTGPRHRASSTSSARSCGAAPTLREGFAGVGKTFGRTDWQLLGDYQDLDGFKRTTLTLNCTLHLAAAGHTMKRHAPRATLTGCCPLIAALVSRCWSVRG